jgi:uncharacterized protein YceK
MKKLALVFAILALSGCSTIDRIFMANYDTNEYALINKVRTTAQLRSCDTNSVKDLYSTSLELKNFSQYLPANEKTISMTSDLYKMVDELNKKPQPISQIYCDLKLKAIETTAENIQSITGKRPR